MAEINLKALLARLNRTCTKALETAAGMCVSRGHYEVTVEHFFTVLSDDTGSDLPVLLHHFGIDLGRLKKAMGMVLDGLRTGNAGRPVFSPRLVELIQDSWMVASLELGHADIRSSVVLVALLARTDRFADGDWCELLANIPRQELKQKLDTLVMNSQEQTQFATSKPGSGGGGAAASGKGGAIAAFCTDFTAKAKEGKIDPVFGRDPEIRQVVDILARRRKNNPILVGEPGVGKTAAVEGLALRIVSGDVPDILKNVRLVSMDLSLMQAGASVKGEFENRMKSVLDEVKGSATPVILFIDEAHTLIGAGGAAGTGDAANLLKPALARGELRTVAATTWAEYKKYFEKDAALARRFQPVKLDEPSVATTLTMLRGLRGTYEKAHGVVIRDDALAAAAELGARYLTGRQHPDKGIDLVDTAAARVKVALASKPGILEDVERRIQERDRTLAALRRDQQVGGHADADIISELEQQLEADKLKRTELDTRWKAEKAGADAVIAARQVFIDAPDEKAREAARIVFDQKLVELKQFQGENPLLYTEVSAQTISAVIADWTGVPMGSMVKDEAVSLLQFENVLKKRIKGQDHVGAIVGERLRAAKAGLKDPRQPLAVFLFVGPSGVGKTETATAIADQLFGGERFMTTINMSEYQEKHTVSRLVGSPPGYVGYGEGGVLTEAVRQRPYSVVLLDEVEKANLDVMNIFYQVFDKGILSDGEGREIDFANTVVVLTSNLATDLITQACADPEKPPIDALVAAIRPQLSRHFKPALLARMTVVPFFTISADALKEIARLKIGRVAARLKAAHKVDLVVEDAVMDTIAARCTEVETGARNVDHIISGTLTPLLSHEILTRLGEGALPPVITVKQGADGNFVIDMGAPAAATGQA